MEHDEFESKSKLYERFDKTIKQYQELKTDNNGVFVKDLKPLHQLNNKIKQI